MVRLAFCGRQKHELSEYMSVCLPVWCLYICLSVFLIYVCMSVCQSVRRSMSRLIGQSDVLLVSTHVSAFVCLCVRTRVYVYVYVYVGECVCVCVCVK